MDDDDDALYLAALEAAEAQRNASQLAGVRAGVSQAHWPGSRWEDRGYNLILRHLEDGPRRLESFWSCHSCGVANSRDAPCSGCGVAKPLRVALRLSGLSSAEEEVQLAIPPRAAAAAGSEPRVLSSLSLLPSLPLPPPVDDESAEEPTPLPFVDADGLATCPTASEGMRFDPQAARTYVFPAQTEQRQYQLDIVKCACACEAARRSGG